jgi:hypothetical protein
LKIVYNLKQNTSFDLEKLFLTKRSEDIFWPFFCTFNSQTNQLKTRKVFMAEDNMKQMPSQGRDQSQSKDREQQKQSLQQENSSRPVEGERSDVNRGQNMQKNQSNQRDASQQQSKG